MSAKAKASGDGQTTLDIALLGRDYKVACKRGEEAELEAAVAFLDRRMREIREGSKLSSPERIAVMAALNLAHEMQRGRSAPTAERVAAAPPAIIDAPAARRRIASMRSAIDQALAGPDKLI
jgi:cell division protein ZapA